MKTLRIASLLLSLLTLTAYALPAPVALAATQLPAATNKLGQAVLLRYRWLRDTELPQLLAWLHEWGPFIRPMPAQAPADPTAFASE